jgi:pimeloyl-ACP methyl ester carboxylesterase
MQQTLKIELDHLTFECLTDGDKENELIIFLHGWPETSSMWKKLMTYFSKEGFYCVAPNLRGYSKYACPEGKEHYSLDKLSNDVLRIFTYLKKSKFHLVGHDWGAIIGWKFVHDNQEKILSWTAISVPHPQAFGKALVIDKEQIKMSQYVKNFQIPGIPEKQIRKDNFKLLRKLWKNSNTDEIEEYLQVFSNPKQLTASINYYRSNYGLLKNALQEEILGDIYVPSLFIWGNKDLAIGSYSVNEGHQYMKNDYIFLELDSGHWLIQTNYRELEKAIGNHVKKRSVHNKER